MVMNKKILVVIVSILCVAVLGLGIYAGYKKANKDDKQETKKEAPVKTVDAKDLSFNERIVKIVNGKVKDNYLISPYSIEIALNMLKDGADGATREQIENVVGTREIPVFTAENRISVVNGAFIKAKYKDYVEQGFYDKLNVRKAEIIYDEFKSPDKINEWVKKNTYEMIPKILDSIDDEFVLGIANAVAIDVEWGIKWKCEETRSMDFTKTDGSKMKTEMMHTEFKVGKQYYFELEGAKGVVLPYNTYDNNGELVDEGKGTQLEFVGILPDGNVKDFVNNLKSNQLKEIGVPEDSSEKFELYVNLPRFKYEYKLEEFADVLKEMGIKDAFSAKDADFTKIISRENIKKLAEDAENIYVSDAIHQTYIDLNEKGTKAAAVTYFGMNYATSSIDQQRPVVKIVTFDKPFVYMIRDSKTKEVLFFGVVETPNKWEGSTCSKEE